MFAALFSSPEVSLLAGLVELLADMPPVELPSLLILNNPKKELLLLGGPRDAADAGGS